MLPIRNVTFTKYYPYECYLYKMLPIRNVAYTKCYLHEMLPIQNIIFTNVTYMKCCLYKMLSLRMLPILNVTRTKWTIQNVLYKNVQYEMLLKRLIGWMHQQCTRNAMKDVKGIADLMDNSIFARVNKANKVKIFL